MSSELTREGRAPRRPGRTIGASPLLGWESRPKYSSHRHLVHLPSQQCSHCLSSLLCLPITRDAGACLLERAARVSGGESSAGRGLVGGGGGAEKQRQAGPTRPAGRSSNPQIIPSWRCHRLRVIFKISFSESGGENLSPLFSVKDSERSLERGTDPGRQSVPWAAHLQGPGASADPGPEMRSGTLPGQPPRRSPSASFTQQAC